MRLYVYVLEAKGLPINGCSYVKLQLGKSKYKTHITASNNVNGSGSDPVWNEDFVFRVHDLDDELIISVYEHDDHSRLFNTCGYLLGRVRIPVWTVSSQFKHCLPPTWFSLTKPKNRKRSKTDCGNILLTLSLHGRGDDAIIDDQSSVNSSNRSCDRKQCDSISTDLAPINTSSPVPSSGKAPQGKKFMKAVTQRLDRILHKNGESNRSDISSDASVTPPHLDDVTEDEPSTSGSFEEAMDALQSREGDIELPDNLPGGVLHDKMYVITPRELNSFIFAPGSEFRKEVAEVQGITELQEGEWTWKSGETPCLTRSVTYINPASKLVKSVKATEEQTYLKADGLEFAVFVIVHTPDVPYGSIFKVELLYKIMPGPELSSGEESSRLVISWGIKFSQSTMMKGIIEGGTRQGLKDSFDQFGNVLVQKLKVLDVADTDCGENKDHILEALEKEHKSDLELATKYFGNVTVVSATFLTLYVCVHILLCGPHKRRGLEFYGLDLPDSFGQVFTCGVLVLLLERVYYMAQHFVQARLHMGSDHGIKSQGDGWVVTVALVEAIDLPCLDPTHISDPFVVLTCNGKTRTSSVQLQTCNPRWNEVLEFDASEELPSVLDVEVFDFDGPFGQAVSLGHAEVNFLKHNASDLADIWIPLKGKGAVACKSKLHLRIFVENRKGVDTIKDYLTKMEKELGKKLSPRSPQKNLAFQKLFGLPPEEFLIKDYSCSLRRKMLLQGRLFLSARIVGFHSNLFGFKTKFFFLWDDIEDIEVLSPSLSSVGSPTLVIILQKGKGLDARHGAKTQDQEGRLRFYFQSFIPFDVASRTIIALWKSRTASLEKKVLMTEENSDQDNQLVAQEVGDGSFSLDSDPNILKIYSANLPVHMKSLLKMFDGDQVERKVMGKSGCLNYVTSQWEVVMKPDIYERQISYKFNHGVSFFGGEVKCKQRKTRLADEEGWVVNEVMHLKDVPFGDHFRVQLRYHIKSATLGGGDACNCDVYMGVLWLKECKFQHRITSNINDKFARRVKDIFELLKTEILSNDEQSSSRH